MYNEKHWDSAYLRQDMSYQCRDTDPDRHKNVIICSSAHYQHSLKISCKSGSFCTKLLTDRQTNKQRRLHILLGGGNHVQVTLFYKADYIAALRTKCGHYIFVLWFLLSFFFFFFSSPNLSGRRLDVYHTSTYMVWP